MHDIHLDDKMRNIPLFLEMSIRIFQSAEAKNIIIKEGKG